MDTFSHDRDGNPIKSKLQTPSAAERSGQQEWADQILKYVWVQDVDGKQVLLHNPEQINKIVSDAVTSEYEFWRKAMCLASDELTEARKGWTNEVRRADTAEWSVGQNCRTIERLEKELTAERQRKPPYPTVLETLDVLTKAFDEVGKPNCLIDLAKRAADTKSQLLSALAAIEKVKEICRTVDLSLLFYW